MFCPVGIVWVSNYLRTICTFPLLSGGATASLLVHWTSELIVEGSKPGSCHWLLPY